MKDKIPHFTEAIEMYVQAKIEDNGMHGRVRATNARQVLEQSLMLYIEDVEEKRTREIREKVDTIK